MTLYSTEGFIHSFLNTEGLGAAYSNTGASHGGEGGGQSSSVTVPRAYGHLTTPDLFGSGGGSNSQARGGGILSALITELRVEGSVEANGMDSQSSGSGGASGGSILIYATTIHGTGRISVREK